ncbi:MAG: hypothetical protein ACE5LQ_08070 [Candidatus Bipolaricaulia bacterium]
MEARIGIRKEDKNRWERRAPLIPEHVRELIQNFSPDSWRSRGSRSRRRRKRSAFNIVYELNANQVIR